MKKAVGLITFFLAALAVATLRADQIVMQNGDTLYGKVLAMTTNSLVLQDENLGTVTLPRAKVSALVFGTMTKVQSPAVAQPNVSALNQPAAPQTPAAPQANSDSDLTSMLRGIRDHTNLIEQVEGQVLGSADPEAMNKFNQLLDGLSSGQIDMNELRAQAQSAANELQQYKKDLGPDFGAEADSYLAILNSFLRETATNSAP